MIRRGQHTTVILDGVATGGQIVKLHRRGRRIVGASIAVGTRIVWRSVRNHKIVKEDA